MCPPPPSSQKVIRSIGAYQSVHRIKYVCLKAKPGEERAHFFNFARLLVCTHRFKSRASASVFFGGKITIIANIYNLRDRKLGSATMKSIEKQCFFNFRKFRSFVEE